MKRLIPNLLTAGNLVGGMVAIVFALTGELKLAPICILISAVLDFLDGFVARLLKVQSELGKQLDSLADMVTFGVAPGIMMMMLLGTSLHANFPNLQYLAWFALTIPVFALFRLAKFNLDTRQTDSFIGLPTPAMTIFFVALVILYPGAEEIHYNVGLTEIDRLLINPFVLLIAILIMSILMVVELPLFALKFKHFKFKGNEIRYIFLTISIILLATLFVWALPIIILLYIILSVINNLTKKESKDEIQS
ncbi:MAG: CDP-diacylglycerol--serine O-phosphatidyltransferase [Crocinitomix sp. MedPE-SWsnd]|nr:MAG: CDP-diacylglycerol--serine O-phosphatidyltransferase [Crocinitomix sp. MedPE-SWsnd]